MIKTRLSCEFLFNRCHELICQDCSNTSIWHQDFLFFSCNTDNPELLNKGIKNTTSRFISYIEISLSHEKSNIDLLTPPHENFSCNQTCDSVWFLRSVNLLLFKKIRYSILFDFLIYFHGKSFYRFDDEIFRFRLKQWKTNRNLNL